VNTPAWFCNLRAREHLQTLSQSNGSSGETTAEVSLARHHARGAHIIISIISGHRRSRVALGARPILPRQPSNFVTTLIAAPGISKVEVHRPFVVSVERD
jgi:hypothetical protein